MTICMPAGASAVPLDQLVDQDLSIVSGTKVFSNFGGSIFTAGCPPGTCAPLLLSAIDIAPFTDLAGNHGIRIQANAQVLNNNQVVLPGQVSHDVVIDYTVTSTAGVITDVILSAVAATSGDASFNVIESFNGSQIAVFIPPGPNSAIAFLVPPVPSLDVTKDIGLLANGCPVGVVCQNSAAWSVIDQTFSQEQVPTPFSLLLLGGGMLGIAWLRGLNGVRSTFLRPLFGVPVLASLLRPRSPARGVVTATA